MNLNLLEYLDEHEFITNPQAESLGVSRAVLSYYVKKGELIRLSQGQYALPDTVQDDLALIAAKSDRIVFSHETALALHRLHNRIPEMPSLTLPQSFSLPLSLIGKTKVYRVQSCNHKLGLSSATTFLGHSVPCYNAERTICDIIRSYSRVDIESYTNALHNYVKNPHRNIPLLMEYAGILKINKKVSKILEVLL